MHCAACSSRIERVVSMLEGVESVAVNLATEKMKCVYDTERIGIETIKDEVEKLGFSFLGRKRFKQ